MVVDISDRLLEAMQFEKKIEPKHFDTNHEVDRYILDFFGWKED